MKKVVTRCIHVYDGCMLLCACCSRFERNMSCVAWLNATCRVSCDWTQHVVCRVTERNMSYVVWLNTCKWIMSRSSLDELFLKNWLWLNWILLWISLSWCVVRMKKRNECVCMCDEMREWMDECWVRWDAMGCDGMRWDAMGCDGMRWDWFVTCDRIGLWRRGLGRNAWHVVPRLWRRVSGCQGT